MKPHRNRNLLHAFAFSLCLVLLAGCLSDEQSGDSAEIEETPTQNIPPTISGTPADAVLIGSSYSFTPTASDPDGDTLTFSAQNVPGWAQFDTSTGTLSGSPTLANVGIFSDIVISVSDGSASASLDAFSVDVAQAANASMEITWTAPTTNTDGTALTNLSGYRIYYGKTLGDYEDSVDVSSAGVSSFLVENLLPGTYYVVATAVNTGGMESAYSNAIVKTAE